MSMDTLIRTNYTKNIDVLKGSHLGKDLFYIFFIIA